MTLWQRGILVTRSKNDSYNRVSCVPVRIPSRILGRILEMPDSDLLPIPVPRLTGDGMYVVTVPTETSYVYGYGDTPDDAIRSAEINKSMLEHESDK